MTVRQTLVVDVECYWGYFFVGFKRVSDGVRRGFEMSDRRGVGNQRETVRKYLRQYETVGYNSLAYDLPMMWYWIEGADNDQLKRASDRIINGNVRWWDVEDLLGVRIPWEIKKNHIDLLEPQPNAIASLKTLNGRLHGKQMQDLPYDPAIRPTSAQMDKLNHYCLQNDLDATHTVWSALEGPLALRRSLEASSGLTLISKSDTQMGLALIKKRVEVETGKKVGRSKVAPGTFRYTPPDYIKFSTPQMVELLARLREQEFIIGKTGKGKGKVALPDWLKKEPIHISDTEYTMGIGGLHSTESNRAVKASGTHALADFDAGAFYPYIIMRTGLYPDAVGPAFLPIYGAIVADRMHAKRTGDKVADKSGKIQSNGAFGSLGSPYSFVYSPQLLIAVTLTGQLTLLMLIEHMETAGIAVVSGNTDGIVLKIPRDMWDGLSGHRPRPSPLADIIENWEKITGFELEGTEYNAIYNQSVGNYFAIKADGGHKRKGDIGNPWSTDPSDFDIRAQMMKNPQMTIISDAALFKIKYGTPVIETIRGCNDMRQFVTVINATGGATWRDEYLGKVVRYYWSTDGDPIIKVKVNAAGNRPKVPKSDGAQECMRLPDAIPDDLDYDRYIAEAEALLGRLGYYGDVPPAEKKIRLTKKNSDAVTSAWATSV